MTEDTTTAISAWTYVMNLSVQIPNWLKTYGPERFKEASGQSAHFAYTTSQEYLSEIQKELGTTFLSDPTLLEKASDEDVRKIADVLYRIRPVIAPETSGRGWAQYSAFPKCYRALSPPST